MRYCNLPECNERHYARGYCRFHWRRLRRKGDPRDPGRGRNNTPEWRFARKFTRGEADECWEWTAGRGPDGYGIFWGGERNDKGHPITLGAHRWAYLHFVGPIPDSHEVCHSCDNPPCVNPAHLYTDTHANNAARAWALGRNAGMPGETNGRAKLTETDVRLIRSTYEGRRGELGELAARYSVARITIANVLNGRSWKYLTTDETAS